MIEQIGCNEEQYKALIDKVGIHAIYNFIKKYGCGAIGLCHYSDDRGRFLPVKYKQDLIASTIMDSLSPKNKIEVLQYLEDMSEGEF